MSISSPTAQMPFHVLAKPVGPLCNLDCKYCFYLEKEKLFPASEKFKMTRGMLDLYVRQSIDEQPGDQVDFAWQGGEPTLLGVNFFREVVALQKQYANGKRISNALQTNATLLDDEWCEFLAANGFLVGVSIDGPAPLHDRYRVDKGGKPTFEKVIRGLEFLKKHRVEFNTLTVVNSANSRQPLEVYRFLKEIGSGFIQFIPLVERSAELGGNDSGLNRAAPPERPANPGREPYRVSEWSVDAVRYGKFLVRIYDEWVRKDVGKTFLQLFDVALGNWLGMGSSLCVFAEKCGRAVAIEHNGDVFSCDHYVYPQYRLGNILNQSLGSMVDSGQQEQFGNAKSNTLPQYCRTCDVRFACHGECPKNRFEITPSGESGLNYLCPAYQHFFHHIGPSMRIMAQLVRARRPAAEIMTILRQGESGKKEPGRNDPCLCGSGRKFKTCCAAKR